MCEPVSIITGVLAVAGAVAGHMQQQSAADAQVKNQEAMMDATNAAMMQTAKSAITEQIEQSAADRIGQAQEQQKTAIDKQLLQKETLEARGTAMASSQAAGGALNALIRDYNRTEAQKQSIQDQQMKMQGAQHDMYVSSRRDATESRIKGQQGYVPSSVTGPSWLATGLGIGSGIMSGVNQYQKTKQYQDNYRGGSTGGTG